MSEKLTLDAVRNLEKTLRAGAPSHKKDAIELLKKWVHEKGLERDEATQGRLDELKAEYLF